MTKTMRFLTVAMAISALVANEKAAKADTLITGFGWIEDGYAENLLFDNWLTNGTIDYGVGHYGVTSSGYGSNWKYIGEDGIILDPGNNYIQLDVTLEGPAEADGFLGPIVTLVDEDLTYYNFAWFGQLLGNHILTMPINSPTWIGLGAPPGSPGGPDDDGILDLENLQHLHLHLDPSEFSGVYTVKFNDLRLITIEGTPGDFDNDGDVDGRDFLVWQRGETTPALDPGLLSDWQTNYGVGALGTFGSVPEPSSIGLMILASASVFGFRRRRSDG